MRTLVKALSVASLVTMVACATESGSTDLEDGNNRGKNDLAGHCEDADGLIEYARRVAMMYDDSLSRDDFDDNDTLVDEEDRDDVNGDGISDVFVYPGITNGTGAKTAVLMASVNGDCSLSAVDLFIGKVITLGTASEITNGMRDVHVRTWGISCDGLDTRWTWDTQEPSPGYVEGQTTTFDACAGT